jgi:hypothetical protein
MELRLTLKTKNIIISRVGSIESGIKATVLALSDTKRDMDIE